MPTPAAPALPPPLAPPPRRHPITVAEYFRMGESGILLDLRALF